MGHIRVRCAASHRYLWFHLDIPFANNHLVSEFRTDGEDAALNAPPSRKQPWDKLTPEGVQITQRVLQIKKLGRRQVRSLGARPDYFCVEVDNERQWERLLPQIVAIIREETNDPTATVRPHIPESNTHVEQWHVPLLNRLFR